MINNLTFNQDCSCIAVSTDSWHKIYNCEPFGEFYASGSDNLRRSISNTDEDISGDTQSSFSVNKTPHPTSYVKMLFSTSLVVIVPKSPSGIDRLLKIYNSKQNIKICDLTFPSHIVDIRLNRKRLVVFLQSQIYIYDLGCVRLMKVLEVENRDEVVGDLSSDDNSLLVIPLSIVSSQTDLFKRDEINSKPMSLLSLIVWTQKSKLSRKKDVSLNDLKKDGHGWVLVYDTINLTCKMMFKAHDSEISKMRIAGEKIATASVKGTIIRVFHFEELVLVLVSNLRRGHNPAKISALSFNGDESLLGCASENSIHLFRLVDESESESESDTTSHMSQELNDNLSKLLVSPPAEEHGYLSGWKKTINNQYTKSIIKKLPYKDYFENLIWEPPKRSFAFIKLPDKGDDVEIGFNGNVILVASYLGVLYLYQLPREGKDGERMECILVNRNELGVR